MTKEESKELHNIFNGLLKNFRIKNWEYLKMKKDKSYFTEMSSLANLAELHIRKNTECFIELFGENNSYSLQFYDFLSTEYFEESMQKILTKLENFT